MSNITFLSHAGCMVIEKFLAEELCDQLMSEARNSDSDLARLVNNKGIVRVDDYYRRTKTANISRSTSSLLREQISNLKPKIEDHFDIVLTGCEKPQVLVYREGDFFKAHEDVNDQLESQPDRNRKISIVIFLNDQSDISTLGDYSGGDLNLYGIIQKPGWEDIGFPVGGRTGLLIAFRSKTTHEVKPVTSGERFTVVSWYH